MAFYIERFNLSWK